MDVVCFCGCRFSCAAELGTCPGCGEYVSLRCVSEAEEKQMRAELDLLLTHVPLHAGVGCGLLRARDMKHEFSNEWGAGAPGSRSSAPESRYV